MPTGSLYLLPSFLGDEEDALTLSPLEVSLLSELKLFFCENEKSCRRFMRKAGFSGSFDEIQLFRLDKDSQSTEISRYIGMLKEGSDAGLISEAGAPALADPGTLLIRAAHLAGIEVIPVPGPSAIMQAVVASGLNGQMFSFKGYLPVDRAERKSRIRELEKSSAERHEAMFFIETPYRNNALLEDLLAVLSPNTLLSISANINQPNAFIRTLSTSSWKRKQPDLHKTPCVFGILA
jgi:16S rRNA (cytidine1402-2'-O)-methyltransferase